MAMSEDQYIGGERSVEIVIDAEITLLISPDTTKNWKEMVCMISERQKDEDVG